MNVPIRRNPITDLARQVIEDLASKGEISIPQLRHMTRAKQNQSRVYHLSDGTVYETTETTIESFDFE